MNQHRSPADRPFNYWGRVCAVIAIVAVTLSACILLFGGKANAAEPYGGCKELTQVVQGLPDMAHTDGARYCRRHGWIVREHVVVTPFGHAFTDLPKCEQEDSIRCYWNARRDGNGLGMGYVAVTGRLIRVDYINGKRSGDKILGYWAIVPDGI